MLFKINNFNKNDLLKLHERIKEARFIKYGELYKPRKDDIVGFYYFYDEKKNVYYNVAESKQKNKKREANRRQLCFTAN